MDNMESKNNYFRQLTYSIHRTEPENLRKFFYSALGVGCPWFQTPM